MPIRIGEPTWRGIVLGAALTSLGLVALAAPGGSIAQPPSAKAPFTPGSAEPAAESLADRLRRAAGSADWEAIESSLDEIERRLGPGEAPRPESAAGTAAEAPDDGVATTPRRRLDRGHRRGGETWGEHWEHFGERMERHWSRAGERRVHRGHDWEEIGERIGEHWGAFGERAGERWGAFGERTGERWGELGERAGTRWDRIGDEMAHRFEEMAERDLPEVIELTIETVLDAFDTLVESLGHE